MTDTTRCDFRDERSCSCAPGECRVSPPVIYVDRRDEDRTLNTVFAIGNAAAVTRYAASVGFAFLIISLSFYQFAIPKSKRMALAQQENAHVVQR